VKAFRGRWMLIDLAVFGAYVLLVVSMVAAAAVA
jgi:hypothetical protein